LELTGRLSRIRDHVYIVMSSGVIAQWSPQWVHLEGILIKVYGGQVYRRMRDVEGGARGGRGMG